MIPAKKTQLFGAWFVSHSEGRLHRMFSRIEVLGLANVRAAAKKAPLLFVVNHTSWWDGLVVLYLSTRVLGVDAFALMNASNLRRVPFFTRVGAFGVDLEDASDGARSIRYAARLLDRPGKVVWIFPQGEERSPFEPIAAHLRPGAAQIGRVAGKRGARVIPVGLRYLFRGEEKAHLCIAFGPDEAPLADVDAGLEQQRAGIEAALARIDRALAADRADPADDADRTVLHAETPGFVARTAERCLAILFPPPKASANERHHARNLPP